MAAIDHAHEIPEILTCMIKVKEISNEHFKTTTLCKKYRFIIKVGAKRFTHGAKGPKFGEKQPKKWCETTWSETTMG